MKSLAAVIAAAGSGLRLKSSTAKQYLELGGLPLMAYALQMFAAFEKTKEIVLVIPRGDQKKAEEVLTSCHLPVWPAFVEGGASRQESVLKGLKALKTEATYVAIHDAARPFASPALLNKLLDAACEFGAAIPVLKPADTVKELGEEGFVQNTLDRGRLGLVQTPQVFKRALIEEAYFNGQNKGYAATDDAFLVEKLGHPVKCVSGEENNFKITTAHQLKLAAWVLKGENF